MREIPKKNYILVFVITIATIGLVVYFSNWYKASKEYYLESSVMTNFLGEIKETEIENYILENPEVVIYISSDQLDETKKFEKQLKDYIIKEEIKAHFIYLNCSKVTNDFLSNFQKKYFKGGLSNIHITYPNLLVVKDGKITDVLYKLKQEPDIKDARKFLEKNGVLENA